MMDPLRREIRRRFSPIVLVSFEESLNSVYLSSNDSFFQYLEWFEDTLFSTSAPTATAAATTAATTDTRSQQFYIRLLNVQDCLIYDNAKFQDSISQKWKGIDNLKFKFDEIVNEQKAFLSNGISKVRSSTTIDHPVACIHAVNSSHPDPIQWLLTSQQTLSARLAPLKDKIISSDILHYFILVRDEETVGGQMDKYVNETFALMCRYFGHNTNQIILHRSKSWETDKDSWNNLIKVFVSNGLFQFMQNFVTSGIPSKGNALGFGFASKILSASKKLWLPGTFENRNASPGLQINSPEFLLRRAIDFSFMIGDWNTCFNLIEGSSLINLDIPEFVISIRILRLFVIIALNKFKELDIYKEIESILLLSDKSIECAYEALSFILKLYSLPKDIFPNSNIQLSIFIKLCEIKLLDKPAKAFLHIYTGRLFSSRGGHRQFLTRLMTAFQIFNSLQLRNTANVIINEIQDVQETCPIKFKRADLEIKRKLIEIEKIADPIDLITILNNYHELLEEEEQAKLLSKIDNFGNFQFLIKFIKPSGRDENFFTTEAQGFSIKENFDEELQSSMKGTLETVSLVTQEYLDAGKLWNFQAITKVISGETLLFSVALVNLLSVPIRLDKFALECTPLKEPNNICQLFVEETYVFLDRNEKVKCLLSIKPKIGGYYKVVNILARMNEGPFIRLPVDTRYKRLYKTKNDRIAKTYSVNPNLCFNFIERRPRISIEVEGLYDQLFKDQKCQITIKVSNTSSYPSTELTLFSSGVQDFPVSGLRIGSLEPFSSSSIPIDFQVNPVDERVGNDTTDPSFERVGNDTTDPSFERDELLLSFIAYEKAAELNNSVVWCKKCSFKNLLSTKLIISEKSSLLILLENVSKYFLLDFGLFLGNLTLGNEITPIPNSLNLPPTQKAIFAFTPQSLFLSGGKEMELAIKCIISGEEYLFATSSAVQRCVSSWISSMYEKNNMPHVNNDSS